jgi:hypothetical protein
MTASVDASGLDRLSRNVQRAVSGGLQDELVTSLHEAERPILTDMRGEAHTKIQKQAIRSVDTKRARDGIEIKGGGGGGGLPQVLWAGGEYGGRKRAKVTYATRSPLGRPYIVRRRTTMQFLPSLGRQGYMYWPTVRDWMPKITKAHEEILEKTLGGD